jgi:ATP-dependent 26S proteasome regulatory subunit
MQIAFKGAIRKATPSNTVRLPCRYISGRRFPSSIRGFRTTALLRNNPDRTNEDQSLSSSKTWNQERKSPEDDPYKGQWETIEKAIEKGQERYEQAHEQWLNFKEDLKDKGEEAWKEHESKFNEILKDFQRYEIEETKSVPEVATSEDSLTRPENPEEKEAKSKTNGFYGSRANRAFRNLRKEKTITLPTVPRWFMRRNVLLHEEFEENLQLKSEANEASQNHISKVQETPQIESSAVKESEAHEEQTKSAQNEHEYTIDQHVYDEVMTLAKAGIKPSQPSKIDDPSLYKPHLILQSPKAGGLRFLTYMAGRIVKDLGADSILFDPTDIAEIAGDFVATNSEPKTNPFRSLGYDPYILDEDLENPNENDGLDEGSEEADDDNPFKGFSELSPGRSSRPFDSPKGKPSFQPLLKSFKIILPPGLSSSNPRDDSETNPFGAGNITTGESSLRKIDPADAIRESLLIDIFLDSPHLKRHPASGFRPNLNQDSETRTESSDFIEARPLVIVIEDFLELNATSSGGLIIDRLLESVRKRKEQGQEILILGLTSSEDLLPSISKSGFDKIQATGQGNFRTVIMPCTNKDVDTIFEKDEKNMMQSRNLENVQSMLRRLAPPSQVAEFAWADLHEDPLVVNLEATAFAKAIWSKERMHRLVSIILGLLDPNGKVDMSLLLRALDVMQQSDNSKYDWLDYENSNYTGTSTGTTATQSIITKLRKTCNNHEAKLLNGVINPQDIKTTFSSVHAPSSTIQSLKTLTSLSLQRPEAFTYGVLATDKIPGLLLYGPPGTGKTLLAKAVAGESGATVLEVSGSDIYDMYVGEGEKNVRAIFTLAQKLSPCVVFIDEADAIFGSRNTSNNRTSHRELINQFLREWDGMSATNSSAFIMVATNRPFDLDDAVLRRLPRRLLVDLPTEKDREAILRIHLKDETLDPSISIPDLATKTPFYSGSDLKNVCVAAALSAVQEEFDARQAHEADLEKAKEPYTYPPRRTLKPAHFDKALADISASISEDMSSLAAIRKFDEKYGDRRGRKKKGGLGFGTISEAERQRERLEEGRVRALV